MPIRDVAAWNSTLSGLSRNGHAEEAISLFRAMGDSGTEPNSLTLSVMLRVCGGFDDQRLGRSVHGYVVRHFEFCDAFLGNSILVYYNKVGEFDVSERFFERIRIRDTVSWNVMMSGYLKNGCPWRALKGFWLLRDEGLSLDLAALEIALQASGKIGEDAIFDGELIHGVLVRSGFQANVYVQNSLLLMYCKCRKMQSAKHVFDLMEVRNLVSWSILVNGYVRIQHPEKAVALFRCVLTSESELSPELMVSALQAAKVMGEGMQMVTLIHCLVIKMGFDTDRFVGSSLISTYGYFGEVKFARRCLDCAVGSSPLACWNSLLSASVHQAYLSDAVEILCSMKLQGCNFDAITLVNILSLCIRRLDLEAGKIVHGYTIRNKFDTDVFITSSLLELYIKCGLLNFACYLFSKMIVRNLVSWNTVIHGCVQNGFPTASLRLFYLMQQKDGLVPDATSLAGSIEAIAQRGYEKERSYIHDYAVRRGLIDDEFVANSLISMHARFHDFDKASMIFGKARKLSSVTWNTMIAEYSSHGLVDKAISVFHLMKFNNVAPDSITLLCLLRGLSGFGSLNCIAWIHAIICKYGYESDGFLGSALIDVYAKCGYLIMGRRVFETMNSKTVVSWNSMIQGYGVHGNLEEACKLFSEMQKSGLEPTMVTFLILISACSHVGDVEKGRYYFDSMTKVYSFSPSKEHFSSYIDLLGRCGLVKEAYEYLEKMPNDPGVCAWGSLLGACRLQGSLDIGLATAQKLFDLDPLHPGYHALLSNLLSETGRWTDASLVKMKIGDLGTMKDQGWSRVESTL